MLNLNISTLNTKLVDMTNNIKTAQTVRANNVRSVINETIAYGNDNKDLFTNKKNAIATFIKVNLTDKEVDTYTKRALKIAKLTLVDGYKAKFDLLTIAQTEQLFTFNKNEVAKLMKFEDDDYIVAVKELIKTAKVERKTKVFSAKLAKKVSTK